MISTLLYLLIVLCLTWVVIQFVGQRTDSQLYRLSGQSYELSPDHFPAVTLGKNLAIDVDFTLLNSAY